MKRGVISLVFLLLGLAIGGSLMWVYTSKPAPPAHEKKVEPPKTERAERKVLFYRNPMNPSVTSPTPMKDPMGMDYIPVYEEEGAPKAEAPGTVRITTEKIQKIGVKSEQAQRRTLRRIIRTVGRVEPVEDKVFQVNAKVSGWIEKLYVNRTDQMVNKGEKLLEIYSPELVSAQQEYLLAEKNFERVKDSPYPEVRKSAESLLTASRQRLKFWDISDDQIESLKKSGAPSRTMAIRSPGMGSVTEKMVVEGQKIDAGEPLFKVIDHSVVWVYGEIYEYEMPYVKVGQMAELSPSYSPTEVYRGRINHIYSHLGSIRYAPEEGTEIRTEKIRFELPNKDHRLKLGMYLNAELQVNAADNAISVPDSAVIDSGTRQIVIIDNRDGTFSPRTVEVGAKADSYYQILRGVREGEWVVTSANFLIDSESNLKAAISELGAPKEKSAPSAPAKKEAPAATEHRH